MQALVPSVCQLHPLVGRRTSTAPSPIRANKSGRGRGRKRRRLDELHTKEPGDGQALLLEQGGGRGRVVLGKAGGDFP